MQSGMKRAMRTRFLACVGLMVLHAASLTARSGDLFPDPELEAAVRTQVFAKRSTKEPLVEADVVSISTVVGRGRGIRSLVGLEKCRSLAMLDLAGNRVTDLSPLEGLPRLQFLDMQSNRVETLQPLAKVTALQYLHVGQNQVRDVTSLSGLMALSALYLSGNRISDASPLFGLRKLASLYLDNNRIESIDGIAQLKGLSSLSLSGNRIEDVGPLSGLGGLQYLFLERNRLRELTVLKAWLDSDREQRFAPYVHIYLDGNPLSSEARKRQLPALKASGARVHP